MALPIADGARTVGHATVLERLWPKELTSSVADFVRAARDLCEFVTKAETLTPADRLLRVRRLFLPLYAAATELPEVEKTSELHAPRPSTPERWPGFAEQDSYWEVFDPYVHDALVAGSLSDDVLDIYHDVRRGLWFWEKNEMADAIWEWRFSFEVHWGDHAVDALRALHRACRQAIC